VSNAENKKRKIVSFQLSNQLPNLLNRLIILMATCLSYPGEIESNKELRREVPIQQLLKTLPEK